MNETQAKQRKKPRQAEPGQRFGMLTAIERLKITGKPGFYWQCKCDCGGEAIVRTSKLFEGQNKSCGCVMRENRKRTHWRHDSTTHGQCRSLAYSSWRHMKTRCSNPNHESYPHYGGRGIKVCERWASSFASFIKDMGERPSIRHEIDRIDNDGDYCPENCRWATRSVQARNKSQTHMIGFNGERKCLTDWAIQYGLDPKVLSWRINRGGWDAALAITTPSKGRERSSCPTPGTKE